MSNFIDDDFKPGTLIKIKNLKSRPELNGRSGVIDGKTQDNGRFPIMCDGEKVLSLKPDCIEVFYQCPNEKHNTKNGALPIIWPHTKKVPIPTIEWLHDDILKKNVSWTTNKSGLKIFTDRLKYILNWPKLQVMMVPKPPSTSTF